MSPVKQEAGIYVVRQSFGLNYLLNPVVRVGEKHKVIARLQKYI